MSAAKAISYAQSAGLPSSLKRRAARAPMAMNASANASPNVFSVIGPMSRFGSTCWRLVLSLAEGLGGIEVGPGTHHPSLAHRERLPRAPGRVQVAHDSTVARKRLQVAQRVHDGPVDAHLEVQVRAEAQAGAADVADDLALRHVLARANGERRLVAIARGE